jgi:hypothetical protein
MVIVMLWLTVYHQAVNKKFFILSICTGLIQLYVLQGQLPSFIANGDVTGATVHTRQLYHTLFPEGPGPSDSAFFLAVEGMRMMESERRLKNDTILTIIDYSKPSTERRLWVIDIRNERILFNTLVAHGKNSGLIVPTNFSNTPQTNMSSHGFFITGETYYGKHGYSLRIDGIEEGINDKARSRAIVIHSADYATMDFIRVHGRLGRSFGCPALPPQKSPQVIDTIKNQSCLFIYSPVRKHVLLPETKQQRGDA